jgi:flagellar motor switch protein FliN/FliY
MDDPAPPRRDGGTTGAALGAVPIELTVSVGRARPLIRDLLALGPDAVLALDRRIEDDVDILVGDRLIARGALVELDGDDAGRLAVRLTQVADLSGGL